MLDAIEQGDPNAAGQLLTLVYDDLRRLAEHKMGQEQPGQTLQSTALVHEVWIRLIGGGNRTFANRAHFFSAAADAMRRILIDRARRRQAQRHGGGYVRIEFEEGLLANPDDDNGQFLAMNDALEKLTEQHPLQARVVKLRYFAGMSNEEISEVMDISISTVKNYWVFARAWLFDQISAS
jgi:RNA polymerase sigma factor (TIGR02999 family)